MNVAEESEDVMYAAVSGALELLRAKHLLGKVTVICHNLLEILTKHICEDFYKA